MVKSYLEWDFFIQKNLCTISDNDDEPDFNNTFFSSLFDAGNPGLNLRPPLISKASDSGDTLPLPSLISQSISNGIRNEIPINNRNTPIPLLSADFLDAMTTRYSFNMSAKNINFSREQFFLHAFFTNLRPRIQRLKFFASNVSSYDHTERIKIFSYCFHELIWATFLKEEKEIGGHELIWATFLKEEKEIGGYGWKNLYVKIRNHVEKDLGVQSHFRLDCIPASAADFPVAEPSKHIQPHLSQLTQLKRSQEQIRWQFADSPFQPRLPQTSLGVPDNILSQNFLGDSVTPSLCPCLSSECLQHLFSKRFLKFVEFADEILSRSLSHPPEEMTFLDVMATRYYIEKSERDKPFPSNRIFSWLFLQIIHGTFLLCIIKLELSKEASWGSKIKIFSQSMPKSLSRLRNFEVDQGILPIEVFTITNRILKKDLQNLSEHTEVSLKHSNKIHLGD
eukprot:Awhi_evm2s8130